MRIYYPFLKSRMNLIEIPKYKLVNFIIEGSFFLTLKLIVDSRGKKKVLIFFLSGLTRNKIGLMKSSLQFILDN